MSFERSILQKLHILLSLFFTWCVSIPIKERFFLDIIGITTLRTPHIFEEVFEEGFPYYIGAISFVELLDRPTPNPDDFLTQRIQIKLIFIQGQNEYSESNFSENYKSYKKIIGFKYETTPKELSNSDSKIYFDLDESFSIKPKFNQRVLFANWKSLGPKVRILSNLEYLFYPLKDPETKTSEYSENPNPAKSLCECSGSNMGDYSRDLENKISPSTEGVQPEAQKEVEVSITANSTDTYSHSDGSVIQQEQHSSSPTKHLISTVVIKNSPQSCSEDSMNVPVGSPALASNCPCSPDDRKGQEENSASIKVVNLFCDLFELKLARMQFKFLNSREVLKVQKKLQSHLSELSLAGRIFKGLFRSCFLPIERRAWSRLAEDIRKLLKKKERFDSDIKQLAKKLDVSVSDQDSFGFFHDIHHEDSDSEEEARKKYAYFLGELKETQEKIQKINDRFNKILEGTFLSLIFDLKNFEHFFLPDTTRLKLNKLRDTLVKRVGSASKIFERILEIERGENVGSEGSKD